MSFVYVARRFLLRHLLTLQVTVLIVAIGLGATMFSRNASGTTPATTTTVLTTTTSTSTTTTTTVASTTTTTTTTPPTTTSPPVTIQGDWVTQCREWMSGIIPEDQQEAALYIIERESRCSYTAKSPRSSATGICQTLVKTHKVEQDFFTDPLVQMRWCHQYAMGRYKSWDNAKAFWVNNRWW